MSFAPRNFLPRGITIADQLSGITAAMVDARTSWAMEAAVVVVVQRHKSEAEAFDLLDLVRPHPATLWSRSARADPRSAIHRRSSGG